MTGPLVSCIMPSKSPPAMVELAIRSFAAQTYQARELVIVTVDRKPINEAFARVADAIDSNWSSGGGLIFPLHIVPPGLSIGELRNVAIRASRGSIIAHWDDDDWSHPTRLERQVACLTGPAPTGGFNQNLSPLVTGHQRYYAIDEAGKLAWIFDGKHLSPTIRGQWVAGGTLAYWRQAWHRTPFDPTLSYGEDTAWHGAEGAVAETDLLYVARLHPGNTSPKAPGTLGWTACDYDEVLAFMGGTP